MSKKKPEKVWMFFGCPVARYADKKPIVGKINEYGEWGVRYGTVAKQIGWDDERRVYANEDRAKVALFAAGFRACQAMYAEMFKEAESE